MAHKNQKPRAKITVITKPHDTSRKFHNVQALIHVGQTNRPSSQLDQWKVTQKRRNLMNLVSCPISNKKKIKLLICNSKIQTKSQSKKLRGRGHSSPTRASRKSTHPSSKNHKVYCNQGHSKWCNRLKKEAPRSQLKNLIIQVGLPIKAATAEVQLGLRTQGKGWSEPPNW